MHNPFLIGEKIYLRAVEKGDAQVIALSENHPEPRQTLYFALPTSVEHHQSRIEELKDDQKEIVFTIVQKDSDQPIGITALFRIDWVSRMAIFYIAIAEKENWSRGYGKETTRMMIDYAFETLNLNRIQLHVSSENEAGLKAYQRVGFQIEGTLSQAMYHDNHYSDFYVMAILQQDWHKC